MMRLLFAASAFALLASMPASAEEAVPPELLRADVERRYESLVNEAAPGRRFAVAIDLAGDNFALAHDAAKGRLRVLYRMSFNQIAEGWSWQPQGDPAHEDYYRYKFLPLGSRERTVGAPYVQEDLPGRPREVTRVWRYDYFLAFDNPYDFFVRPTVEDDAGFSAEVPLDDPKALELLAPGRIGMLALASWTEPRQAESTTFWKATDGRPVDRTLKNRYLIGRLEEVWFVDTVDGLVLAKLLPQRH